MPEFILVTGGAGYIGGHACLALIDAGYGVVVLDNLSTGHRVQVPDQAIFIEGAIDDVELVRETLRRHSVRSVMHFAGSVIVSESVSEPLKYYENNVSASIRLIESCLAEGVEHFIFSSTAAIYGNPEIVPVPESAPGAPISPYGHTKLAIEWFLKDVAGASTLKYATLRYFNVAGADPKGRAGQMSYDATHLIKVACQLATGKRQSMEIFGDDYSTPDGTCVRDFIHVSDLAAGHVSALQYLASGKESITLNCGYGHGLSVHEVLSMVERIIGQPLNARLGARRPGDVECLIADNTRILKVLDWKPQFDDIESIVKTSLKFEQRLESHERT